MYSLKATLKFQQDQKNKKKFQLRLVTQSFIARNNKILFEKVKLVISL